MDAFMSLVFDTDASTVERVACMAVQRKYLKDKIRLRWAEAWAIQHALVHSATLIQARARGKAARAAGAAWANATAKTQAAAATIFQAHARGKAGRRAAAANAITKTVVRRLVANVIANAIAKSMKTKAVAAGNPNRRSCRGGKKVRAQLAAKAKHKHMQQAAVTLIQACARGKAARTRCTAR